MSFDSSAQLPPLLCTQTSEQTQSGFQVCDGNYTWISVTKSCTKTELGCARAMDAATLCAIQDAQSTLQAILEGLPPCPED